MSKNGSDIKVVKWLVGQTAIKSLGYTVVASSTQIYIWNLTHIRLITFADCVRFIYPPAGEAPRSPQRPNAPGGGGQTASQRETEAPVRCAGQHHRTLDPN